MLIPRIPSFISTPQASEPSPKKEEVKVIQSSIKNVSYPTMDGGFFIGYYINFNS